jgi:hypothetical protein
MGNAWLASTLGTPANRTIGMTRRERRAEPPAPQERLGGIAIMRWPSTPSGRSTAEESACGLLVPNIDSVTDWPQGLPYLGRPRRPHNLGLVVAKNFGPTAQEPL